MKDTAPTQDQAMCFYRAALSTARLIDRENEHPVLDADADAAWRAYGGDLPPVVRCDLVLRNLATLYPAASAPGPVFSLSGWYEDDPWGAGFERPPVRMVEGRFAARAAGRLGARGRKPAPERAAAAEPRAPARAGRPARGASADEAAIEAVRARDEGAGVAAADLGQQLGLSASALKKTVDALVEAGRLVEKKKRPRTVAYTTDGAGGGEGAGA